MLGDRCARHSVIVEVESDTDKNIEQLQTNEERMFPAYTQAGKKADRSKMRYDTDAINPNKSISSDDIY